MEGQVGETEASGPCIRFPLPNLFEKGCGKGPCFLSLPLPQVLVLSNLLVFPHTFLWPAACAGRSGGRMWLVGGTSLEAGEREALSCALRSP